MGSEHLPAPGREGAAMRAAGPGPPWPPPAGAPSRPVPAAGQDPGPPAGSAEAAAALGGLRGPVGELVDPRPRALADVEDVGDRFMREIDLALNRERERIATAWPPVLDHLDIALSRTGAEPIPPAEGVRAARDQGVGAPARPGRHEAVSVSPHADAPDGTVLHVVRPGHGDGHYQLRPAVVVAKKAD